MSAAALEGVTKRFGQIVALQDVSVSIAAGSTVALLGANGAGKSTFAGLLAGLRHPDEGTVRVAGRDPRHHRARAALGVAPQETAFPETLRARELVEFAARHFPAARRPDDLLDAFGLRAIAQRQVGGLSVGQRRRLGVALAFAGRPLLVVLDEPTAGLDADGRRAVWDAVKSTDAAVVVATHQLDEAEAVADRIVALDGGRIVADGPVAAVKGRAGRTRIRFRGERPPIGGAVVDGGWVTIETNDAASVVRELVRAGVPLDGLEVRPQSLEEALASPRDEG